MVQSACVKLSDMYTGTKGSHPKLRSVCEVLESRVTALLSPVIVKLEPHCKYWLMGTQHYSSVTVKMCWKVTSISVLTNFTGSQNAFV